MKEMKNVISQFFFPVVIFCDFMILWRFVSLKMVGREGERRKEECRREHFKVE